jgi:anoctamin-10/anoctamin-7
MTEVEREFMRPDYEEFDGIVNDYAESVILFGFTTMFISAFPLSTFLAFLYSFVEAKIYAWKLCHVYRRPQPKTAQDMGTWYWVLEMISVSAVLTNAGIVAFTGIYSILYT